MKNARRKIIIISAIVAIAILVTTLITISIASTNSGIAKSKTFDTDMDGYYVYFRAVDEAGNAGDWSNAQRIWIDTKAPNVSAKEASVTIEEGTVATLVDYFTVEANGGNSDIDVVCTIGGVEYTDTETLTAEGSPYTVVCEASKNGGKSNSAKLELVVEPSGPEPWDGTVASSFARGSGTEADPYIIETPQQLAYMRTISDLQGLNFKLGADLDLGGVQAEDGTWSGQQWVPINVDDTGFSFDGAGFEIYNIYIESTEDYAGLFGQVYGPYMSDGVYPIIKNVTIKSRFCVADLITLGLSWEGPKKGCIFLIFVTMQA